MMNRMNRPLIPYHILGPLQGLAARLALLACCLMGGCVTAGVHNDTTTTTTYDSKGGVVKVEVVRRQGGSYSDTRAAGQAAEGFLSGVGGVGGVLSAISPAGALWGGGGILALLGLAHNQRVKAVAVRSSKDGEDKGWTEAAATYSAPPIQPKGQA